MQENAKTNSSIPDEHADIETATDAYAGRFSGGVGAWMLQRQERITMDLLAKSGAKSVLDVGGGHGQLARPMAKAGYQVTVHGSAPSCAHRIRDLVESHTCAFVVSDMLRLPFADKSFDAVIAFRLVTHCQRWPELLREMCRVARTTVIIDYPTSQSVNAIAPALFEAKKKVETNTRHWTLFRHAELDGTMVALGFQRLERVGQFFFPMVVHRMLKCAPVSRLMEAVSSLLGLNARWGSPVIVRFTRAP